MRDHIRIGTRKSALALWQAEHISAELQRLYPNITVELVHFNTKGDRILEKPLAQVGGKGLFTAELEEAMHKGDIDIAVHSLKDMPTELPEGLTLGAISAREVPYDALVSPVYKTLDKLPEGARVGTSSLRRQAQLLHKLSYLTVRPMMALLTEKAERIRRRELHRALAKLPDISDKERRIMDSMSRMIIRKMLREPMIHFNEIAGTEEEGLYWDLFKDMFNLEKEG